MRALVPVVVLATACSSPSSRSTNAGNGVDDVKQACALRSHWLNATTSACTVCLYEVPVPACSCDTNPDRGVCSAQAQALDAEADCTQTVTMCVDASKEDCTLMDACYAGPDACRAAAAAFDGCVVAACDLECR